MSDNIQEIATPAEETNTVSLVDRLYANSERYITADDSHSLTLEDKVHGAVYKALAEVEQVLAQHSPAPYPFDAGAAASYAHKRDNAGHDTLGRTVIQIDQALFD